MPSSLFQLCHLSGVEDLVLDNGQRVHGQAADFGREVGVLFSHGVVGEVRERRVVEDWKDGGEVVWRLELLGRVGMLALNAVKLAGKLSCTRNYLIN